MGVNYVEANGEELINLTNDTVTPETLAEGTTAHDAAGNPIVGVAPTDAVRYNAQSLTEEQKTQARGNIGAVAKNQGAENVGKILVVGTDGNLILTDMPEGGTSGDVIGVLDESNNILLSGNLADGTYTLKYVNADGTYTEVGTLEVGEIVRYTITQNLTNVTSNNTAVEIEKGESLSITLIANDGYELKSVTVTMGGEDITSSAVSGGTISIVEVTGDVVITAVAEEAVVEIKNWITNSQNADGSLFVASTGEKGYKPNTRLGTSDGGERTQTGVECTGYIPVVYTDTLYFKGVTITSASSETTVAYDSNHARISGASSSSYFGTMSGEVKAVKLADIKAEPFSNETNRAKIAYIRISANVIDADSIITKNQPIE